MGSRSRNANQLQGHSCVSLPSLHSRSTKHTFQAAMASTPWGYEEHNGPEKWHIEFPVAKEGKRQSPIDLSTELAQTDSTLGKAPITCKYVDKNILNIENTGASWKVNVDGAGSSLKGGALQGEYQLWQFHAHWGDCNEKGSEHTVEGKMYPAELHLVHWTRSSSRVTRCLSPSPLSHPSSCQKTPRTSIPMRVRSPPLPSSSQSSGLSSRNLCKSQKNSWMPCET